MLNAILRGEMIPEPAGPPGVQQRDLVDWLETGRLTLVDANKQVVAADRWFDLSPEVRERAMADFERVVRGNAKAAVLFLRD